MVTENPSHKLLDQEPNEVGIGVRASNDLWKMYIKGKSWKCDDRSPTGAHYWLESKKGGEYSHFTCKYCGEIRKMCNTYAGCMNEVARKLRKSKTHVDNSMDGNFKVDE